MNERITGGADQIELVAATAGNVSGYTLHVDITAASPAVSPSLLATLPDLTVAAGDFIVVHLKPAGTVTTETSAGGKAGCNDATCSASAWDVASATTQDLADTAHVLTLSNAGGTLIDGFAYSNGGGPTSWPAQLQPLQAAGAWDPTPCPNACAMKTDADTLAVATGTAGSGVATSVGGNSMQRSDAVTPSGKSHWTVAASTWGAAN